jgi:hypothetical protein
LRMGSGRFKSRPKSRPALGHHRAGFRCHAAATILANRQEDAISAAALTPLFRAPWIDGVSR